MASEGIIRELLKLMSRRRQPPLPRPPRKPPRKPPGRGGSEPVMAEPGRPKLGEGGAAAALEFDD